MKRILPLIAIAAIAYAMPLRAADDYPITEDSKPHDNVPKGEIIKFTFEKSQIFPGTTRDVWVYVPRQYDPAKPACVYVNQDGIQWNAPTVFDNLIAKNEIPVTIGVFVMHGRVKAPNGNALDRFNRSYEYDGLGDNYARFLLEELLPEVETKKTGDGRAIVLSKNGNDRAIGGSSSGAVCAFTAAWERPDAFSRVFSAIGTYVGLRGANEYPTIIRKYEPKPIRVFLQDGSADQNIYGGDWWMANQEMQRSLAFAGYEVNHAWGTGGHNGAQGTQVFPDAMRWLWKDWPQPVKAGLGASQMKEILIPGENWQAIGAAMTGPIHLSVNEQGEVFGTNGTAGQLFKVGADSLEMVAGKSGLRTYGPQKQMFLSSGDKISVFGGTAEKLVAKSLPTNALIAKNDGSLYIASTSAVKGKPTVPQLWRVSATGEKKLLEENAPSIGGLTLSPDQTLLYVNDAASHWVYSYQIQPDGSLQHKQRYYHLHTPDTADNAGAGEMCVDRDGRLYVATAMGLQVCDQAGRVNSIIPVPGGAASSVVLGGTDFDTLFVASGGKIYKRKVKPKGAPSFLPPVKPAAPRL